MGFECCGDMQALLHRLLINTNEAESDAACQLFGALCHHNADGQIAWTAMLPSSTPKPLSASQAFGDMLVAGLLADPGPQALPGTATCCHACCVLAALTSGNANAKQRALKLQVEMRSGRLAAPKQLDLMGLIMFQLSRAWSASSARTASALQSSSGPASGPRSGGTPMGNAASGELDSETPRHGAAGWAVPAALALAITLLHNCPEAVVSLLHDAAHVPLLLEIMQTPGGLDGGLIRGLAAAVLGACVTASAQGGGEMNGRAANVVEMLSNRVGIRDFFAVLEGLLETGEMQVCLPELSLPTSSARLGEGGGGGLPFAHSTVGVWSMMFSNIDDCGADKQNMLVTMQEAVRRCQGQPAASEYGLYPGILSRSLCETCSALVPKAKECALALFAQPASGPRSGPAQADPDAASQSDTIIAECATCIST